MNLAESLRVAMGSLAANKMRSSLTMLGIIIGVGAVIAMMSIGRGAQAQVTDQIRSMGTNLLFMTDNLKDSFYNAGEYPDAVSAKTAFDNLKSATVPAASWEGLASPLKVNQIWIYRTGQDTYAKIRIISLIGEIRNGIDYAKCTFEWEYQPDGTLTFPGK